MEKTKSEDFIYETKVNAIYSDGVYYYLLHFKTGKVWRFDKDKAVLDKLIEYLEKNGSVNGNGFNNTSKTQISQILWKLYYPYNDKRNGRVLFADGNAQNLSSSNLYIRGDCVAKNQNRRIWHNNDRIYIQCSCNTVRFSTDYEPGLFDLLCCSDFSAWCLKDPHSSIGYRLITSFGKIRVNLAEIVYGYYNYGLRAGNISKVLPKMKKQLSPKGLEIDHLRNNPENNTIHNLVLMPKRLNAKKGDLIARIGVPFWFVPVQKDGKIRVSLGDATTPNSERFLLFNNAKDFVVYLQQYQRECFLSRRMRDRAREPGKTNCISKMLDDDGQLMQGKDYNMIEVLLNMSEDQFQKIS